MDITKVIIPAAGTGEQFLPYSKVVAREMLPLLRKPAIQHIAEEVIASQLAHMILVNSPQKHLLTDHLNPHAVEPALKEADAADFLSTIEKIIQASQLTTLTQREPRGTAHAVWLARHCLQPKEYFGVAYPDEIIFNKQPALSQLMRIARQEKVTVLAVQEVPSEALSSYGIINIKKTINPSLFQVSQIIEKPQPKDAPSSLAVVGRYVLSSKIIGCIDSMLAYDDVDLSLTDAINQLIHSNERVFAYKVQGTRYDIGSHLGWVKAVIDTSLQDKEMGASLKRYLEENLLSKSGHSKQDIQQDTL